MKRPALNVTAPAVRRTHCTPTASPSATMMTMQSSATLSLTLVTTLTGMASNFLAVIARAIGAWSVEKKDPFGDHPTPDVTIRIAEGGWP